MTTFSEIQDRAHSQKVGLVSLVAAKRLVGWILASGSIWRLSVSEQVLVSVADDGAALSSVASFALVTAGTYYHDRINGFLYVRLADSTSPDASFTSIEFKLFFATQPVAAPHDLETGFEVLWLPLLLPTSSFLVEVENTKQFLGVALTASSSIKFANDQSFWSPLFDRVTFDTKEVLAYSWSPSVAITEATLVYKGVVVRKGYTTTEVSFEVRDKLDELRAPVALAFVGDLVSAKVTGNLSVARQRRLYGFVRGHLPTPIDQVLSNGYGLTGTFAATNGLTAVTGTGTSFLSELSPGDEIQIGGDSKVRIETVTSDTALVLSEAYPLSSASGAAGRVHPSHPKRYANRNFLIAGHALARTVLTVTGVIDSSAFYVDSTDDIEEGDVLEFNGSQGVVRVLGDGFVKLVTGFTSTPSVASTIVKASVGNVYLDNDQLLLTRDFTYDATTAILSLTTTAEFNLSLARDLTGTFTLTNGVRTVVGVGTLFRSELNPGDWIRRTGTTTWFEILEVTDDLNITLRTAPTTEAGNSAGQRKNPKVYSQSSSVLSCDALGRADESGRVMKVASDIVKDLLVDASVTSVDLDTDSFTTGKDLAPYRLGFAIPEKYTDTKAPTLREIITKVCRSSFSILTQTNEFLLRFSVIEPSFEVVPSELREEDVVGFNVKADSSQVIKKAIINYGKREWDTVGRSASQQVVDYSNDQYLTSTEKEFTLDSYLIDEDDAIVMASRWAFLLQYATSDVEIQLKMKALTYVLNDVLKFSHEKLYYRIGSTDRSRIGIVLSIKKGVLQSTVLISDLGNSFSRCARICEEGSPDFDDSSEAERLIHGFMTDENGLSADAVEGINLIW